MRANRVLALCLILFMQLPGMSHASSFVTVKDRKFFIDEEPYYYVGANFWQGANLGSTGPTGDRERLLRELDQLNQIGVKNLRIMAGTEGPDTEILRVVPAMQSAPGVYNLQVLEGLDFLLKAMGERGMKAIMCLNNFWHWSGGMAQYVSWADKSKIPYPPPASGGDWETYQRFAAGFYSNPLAMKLFDDHIRFIVSRRNTLTGGLYKDDPTIMSWQLANEPRGKQNRSAYLAWIRNTAALVKSLDSNHLVTIGSEGDTPSKVDSGTDYYEDHGIPNIDYGTMHVWIENFGWYQPEDPEATYQQAVNKALDYMGTHVHATDKLHKPIVLEEFGIARDYRSMDPHSTTSWRDLYYQTIFAKVYEWASAGYGVAGANVWAWSGEARPRAPYGKLWGIGSDLLGDPPHEPQGWYGIYNSDASTIRILEDAARNMATLKHR